jgi:hypothetical protein
MKFPIERARALLERLIPADGGVPARKVHEAARRANLPEWAIRKARRSLEIEVEFVGFGADGWWEWRWAEPRTLPDPEPAPPASVCAWPECGLPPRSRRAAYCTTHKQEALRRNKRAWARKDRALLHRVRKRLARRVDRTSLRTAVKTATPVLESPSACLPAGVRPITPPAMVGATETVPTPPGHRAPNPPTPPPPSAPGRWMTPEELDAEVERLRGRASVRGPRHFGPPQE